MKRIITILAVALLANSGRAETPLTKEDAAALKSVEIAKLRDRAFEFQGKLVRFKFNRRSQLITKIPTGGAGGTVYDSFGYLPNDRGGSVEVIFPEAGLAWYQRITTEYGSRKAYSAIGRVLVKDSSTIPLIELIGRELKTDLKGAKAVW